MTQCVSVSEATKAPLTALGMAVNVSITGLYTTRAVANFLIETALERDTRSALHKELGNVPMPIPDVAVEAVCEGVEAVSVSRGAANVMRCVFGAFRSSGQHLRGLLSRRYLQHRVCQNGCGYFGSPRVHGASVHCS